MHRHALRHALPLALTMLFTLGSCGDDSGPSYADLLDERQAEKALQADLFCDCYESFPVPMPFANKDECVAFMFQPYDADTRQCVVDAAALYPTLSSEYIECELTAERMATECVTANIDCADIGTVLALCSQERESYLELCDPLPPPVLTAMGECTAPAPGE